MAYRVQILETGQAFMVAPDESVLQAAERVSVRLPHECTFEAAAPAVSSWPKGWSTTKNSPWR